MIVCDRCRQSANEGVLRITKRILQLSTAGSPMGPQLKIEWSPDPDLCDNCFPTVKEGIIKAYKDLLKFENSAMPQQKEEVS